MKSFRVQRRSGPATATRRQTRPGEDLWSPCQRHAGGLETDCIFTLDKYRGSRYVRKALERLLDGCGSETICIHSTLPCSGSTRNPGGKTVEKGIRERFVRGGGGGTTSPHDAESHGLEHQQSPDNCRRNKSQPYCSIFLMCSMAFSASFSRPCSSAMSRIASSM